MNEQVQKFLESKRQEELCRREKHLKSLGLVEGGGKGMRKYVDRSEINLDDSNMLSHGYEKDENGKWFYYDAKVQNLKAIDVTDEEYAEICKYCPPLQVASNTENKDDELLKQVDSIRKMVKFFTILMIISLVLAVILGIIIGLKPSYY